MFSAHTNIIIFRLLGKARHRVPGGGQRLGLTSHEALFTMILCLRFLTGLCYKNSRQSLVDLQGPKHPTAQMKPSDERVCLVL